MRVIDGTVLKCRGRRGLEVGVHYLSVNARSVSPGHSAGRLMANKLWEVELWMVV